MERERRVGLNWNNIISETFAMFRFGIVSINLYSIAWNYSRDKSRIVFGENFKNLIKTLVNFWLIDQWYNVNLKSLSFYFILSLCYHQILYPIGKSQ